MLRRILSSTKIEKNRKKRNKHSLKWTLRAVLIEEKYSLNANLLSLCSPTNRLSFYNPFAFYRIIQYF